MERPLDRSSGNGSGCVVLEDRRHQADVGEGRVYCCASVFQQVGGPARICEGLFTSEWGSDPHEEHVVLVVHHERLAVERLREQFAASAVDVCRVEQPADPAVHAVGRGLDVADARETPDPLAEHADDVDGRKIIVQRVRGLHCTH